MAWVFVFFATIAGPRSISFITYVTALVPFALLIPLLIRFLHLDGENSGNALSYYFGGKKFLDEQGIIYDTGANRGDLMQDAYSEVFFSVSVCVGVYFSYGSFNDVKQPVIGTAFAVGIIDFLFSIAASIIAWCVMSFLMYKKDTAAYQNSSVGLGFIALP